MYKKLISPVTEQEAMYVQRLSDGAYIPFDEANTDYQAYLKWLEESPDNIPQEAE